MKKITGFAIAALITVRLISQEIQVKPQLSTNDATVIGKLEYPYHFKFEGNPVSRKHSAADPDVQVYDDTLWVYCSQDRKFNPAIHKKGYDSMDGYHLFSTKDMVNWIDHGQIFNSRDVSWAHGEFLWAPGSARKNGKYYLYYPIKDKQLEWKIGVAIGETPAGPFKDTGKPIEGLGGIDPQVFIDDNGEAYIYCNDAVVAKLKPNMIELAEAPRKIVYGTPEQMKEDKTRFSEGSYMHKRNGIYYYSYTALKNDEFQNMYAMGKSPYGPFELVGPAAEKPRRAQDHHSIVEFKGNWYYFYHVAFKSLPEFKEGQGRVFCFDKLFYNPDGTIQRVKHELDPHFD